MIEILSWCSPALGVVIAARAGQPLVRAPLGAA